MSNWVVGAVIVNSRVRPTRVLAARRRDVPLAVGPWEFPGGKVEEGETPQQALVRELREELAIDAVVADEIDEPRGGWAISDALRLRLFLAETWDTPHAGPAHDEVDWVDVERLDGVHWLPGDRAALPAVLAALEELRTAGLSSGHG